MVSLDSGADSSGVWKAGHLATEHGFDDRVQVGSPSQVFHSHGVWALRVHGVDNGFQGGEVLKAVHGC